MSWSAAHLSLGFLYGINHPSSLGWSLIPFYALILIAGWFIGFFICGLLINWGLKAQDFVFTVGWIFAPFCAIYYPLEILPTGYKPSAKHYPMTYVFEAMRHRLQTGTLLSKPMLMSFALNAFYFTLCLLFFRWMFELSKKGTRTGWTNALNSLHPISILFRIHLKPGHLAINAFSDLLQHIVYRSIDDKLKMQTQVFIRRSLHFSHHFANETFFELC